MSCLDPAPPPCASTTWPAARSRLCGQGICQWAKPRYTGTARTIRVIMSRVASTSCAFRPPTRPSTGSWSSATETCEPTPYQRSRDSFCGRRCMRRPIPALTLPLLLALLLASCRRAPGPEVIAASLTSARTVYAVGDTFRGTLTFTNTASAQVAVEAVHAPVYSVLCYNDRDSVVAGFPGAKLLMVTPMSFAPWERKSWPIAFRLEQQPVPSPSPLLPAGDYRLRGQLDIYGPSKPYADLPISIE